MTRIGCWRGGAARRLCWLRQHRAARPAAGARAARASQAARDLQRAHWRGLRLTVGGRLRARGGDGPARGPDARRDVRWARGLGPALVEELRKGAEWRANKLTASEYDETTWSARTWMAFTTQRLSVAVQYSAAHRRWPRRLACRWRPTHERRPREAARGKTLGGPRGEGEFARERERGREY